MWGLGAGGSGRAAADSGKAAAEQLQQKVSQLSTGVVALPYDITTEPCKGLAQVMQHVQSAVPSLVRSRQALQGCLDDMRGIGEELRDSAGTLEELGGPAGCGAVDRTLEHLARAADLSLQRPTPHARVLPQGPEEEVATMSLTGTLSFGSTARMTAAMSGEDTFRGTNGSSLLRSTLYEKNSGDTRTDRCGLVRTQSPVSGNTLLSTTSGASTVKDPISGSHLHFSGSTAEVRTPAQKQQFLHSRNLYLTKDIDVTIQILRNTTKVSKYTNERIGTAGTSTGLPAWQQKK
ncbi:hypothetical protein FOA52_011509 [Chlamydomonas sp. UWO 241]|nr:hypothetical protein FOA52_011509 [Chlamydomonas sp. UWO 241]